MRYEKLRELHDLLFKTIGLFHEKFLCQFRKESPRYLGVKKNHIMIIGFLYRHQTLTATEIAKKLNMEKGSLTTLIDQLEEFGLVTRCKDLNDRRKTLISLTNAGKVEMEAMMRNSTQRMNEILSNADPNELLKFISSLRYAVEFMQKIKKVN
ncbi:MarR family winged helix-turn-helix transcriptional regulator [Clostridium sp. BJN0013]|uniref:MarR family winged helix-turn-helix transcriptional regulator n=1 Tax=Clostridium sp. BJN0013 TaxID=3236840 RepID=UPI0034C600DD